MRRLLFACICCVSAAGAGEAQTPPIELTLADAVARGLEASHRVVELTARADAARAVQDQRKAATLPQATLVASYVRTNHVEEFSVPNASGGVRVIYPDIPDNVRSRVDLQWPIYTGGRLQLLTKAAGAEADAAGQDREAMRADLKLEITRVYLAVLTARASQNVVQQALERTSAHLAEVRNQFSVGLVPPSDVLSIEAQQARQQMLRIEAENILETASADFRRLVGLDPDARFELADAMADLKVGTTIGRAGLELQDPPNNKAVVDLARANRPERKALTFRIGAAAERAFAASAGSLPLLTAVGGYDFARPNPRIFPIQNAWKPSWDLGVQVRWPIFDGGRTRAEAAEASALHRVAEARLRDFDSNIEVEIRQRSADLRSAQASVEAAQAGVRAAAEARRVLAERFGAGVATNTDVLTAQVALLQAELDLTRARANTLLASARLDRAMGR
ncbi:MAG TPA: TolC family protein [Vicinamibacterales bacterium]|nr:TolC family protein [Vicinamibacterales bacterium]